MRRFSFFQSDVQKKKKNRPDVSSDWLPRSLAPASKGPPLRDLPTNPQQPAPRRDPGADASSRLGPTWLRDKPSSAPSPSPPPSRPVSALSSGQTSAFTPAAAAARPTPAPRASTTAAKTLQSKIQFFQSDESAGNEGKASNAGGTGAVQHATAGETVTITVNVGKNGGSGKASESSKAKAAAFISRKLAEDNDHNKPSWTNVALKKTDK